MAAMTSIASAAGTGEVDQAEPSATPTDTSSPEPTDTSTAEPTDTSSPEPTGTSSPEPTETSDSTSADTGSTTSAESGSGTFAESGSTPSAEAGSETSTDSDSAEGGSGTQPRAAESPRATAVQAQASAILGPVLESFAVLGGSTVTNTGPSVISGNLGVFPGCSVTGFDQPGGPGLVINGTIHACDAVAELAQQALIAAYNDLAGRPCGMDLTDQDLGTLTTLTEGVYCFSTSAQLTGALTLQGGPDDVFIFQIGSTLTTAPGSSVNLIGGAQSCNVFFQVGSSATLGTGTDFTGNVVALTSITANTGATVDGRLLARNGAVTLDTNLIRQSECDDGDGDGDNGDGDNGDNGDGDGEGDGGRGDGDNGDGDGDGGRGDGANGGGGHGAGGDGDNGGGDSRDLTLASADNVAENAAGTLGAQGGPEELAFTGTDIRILIALGILTLLLGAGLLRIARPSLKE